MLDGLTGEQRFFASWAAGWRQVIRTEEAIRTARHGPALPQRVPHQRDRQEPRRLPRGVRRHGGGRHVDAAGGARQHLVRGTRTAGLAAKGRPGHFCAACAALSVLPVRASG